MRNETSFKGWGIKRFFTIIPVSIVLDDDDEELIDDG
jgi:hypothetical protein